MEFAITALKQAWRPAGADDSYSREGIGVFYFEGRRGYMEKYILIAAGAIPGAFFRYWLTLWAAARWGTQFAYGTLLINLIGSFVLGLFLPLSDRGLFPPNARFLVAVGWCATFTTYSTFSWDTFRYVQEGNLRLALVNASLTLLGCLCATWAGVTVAKLI